MNYEHELERLVQFYENLSEGALAQLPQSITPLSVTLNGVAVVDGSSSGTGTHFGLPVIGAMFHNYTNAGIASSYGGVIPHKYTRNIDIVNRAP